MKPNKSASAPTPSSSSLVLGALKPTSKTCKKHDRDTQPKRDVEKLSSTHIPTDRDRLQSIIDYIENGSLQRNTLARFKYNELIKKGDVEGAVRFYIATNNEFRKTNPYDMTFDVHLRMAITLTNIADNLKRLSITKRTTIDRDLNNILMHLYSADSTLALSTILAFKDRYLP